ncbi:MAG: TlpA family protein disulfide reductase [Acidobacteria bacterium]|nr:TlpA family protein disulfide reductase [Acidobacteriota bacterium]
MKRAPVLLLWLGAAALAQQAADPQKERTELQEALSETGSSQIDFIRVLEQHLRKYPASEQKAELHRALLKASMELKDRRRTLQYGEMALKADPTNIEVLERVARYLLEDDDPARAKRALDYAHRLENLLRPMSNPQPGKHAARYEEEKRIVLGKALVYQARATGNLDNAAAAVELAQRSYTEFPAAEAAREAARWLEKQGKLDDAVNRLADAFMMPDPNATDADRQKDRERLGEWAKCLSPGAPGVGERLLAAYDRTRRAVEAHKAALRKIDPNAAATQPMEYVISGLNGEQLPLASLKGKVVVFDFWATWCGPCRAQQSLYEQVKQRFAGDKNVVFLNVSTDENRNAVKPFLDANQWKKTVYFEDGLSALLRVSSIPTTMIVNGRGEIVSRMNGYVPEKFVETLTARIKDALAEK